MNEELHNLEAEPPKQGFFKGLLSSLKAFVKENASTMLAIGVMSAATVLTGGAATIVPLLIGLAAGGATVGACSALMPKNTAASEDAPAEEPAQETPQSGLFDPAERQRAEDMKRRAEAFLDQKMLEEGKAVGPGESVDLLGLDDPQKPDSEDLLVLDGQQATASAVAAAGAAPTQTIDDTMREMQELIAAQQSQLKA